MPKQHSRDNVCRRDACAQDEYLQRTRLFQDVRIIQEQRDRRNQENDRCHQERRDRQSLRLQAGQCQPDESDGHDEEVHRGGVVSIADDTDRKVHVDDPECGERRKRHGDFGEHVLRLPGDEFDHQERDEQQRPHEKEAGRSPVPVIHREFPDGGKDEDAERDEQRTKECFGHNGGGKMLGNNANECFCER